MGHIPSSSRHSMEMTIRWDRQPDAALLRAAALGEAAAFEAFYLRHERVVATYLHRRTRDPHRTADLAAEVFAQAFAAPASFRGGADDPAIGWLLGIARHLHLRAVRSGGVEQRALSRLGAELPPPSDATAARLDALLGADVRATLRDALAGLTEDQRTAVVAFVIDDLTHAELAAALGLPEATVRKRVSRGLLRLRTTIGARP
ncbi:MAG: sigma-70 family RNA polymerase sigma factor [Patulibacter minatonensis]